MKATDQKALTIRTEDLADIVKKAAAYLREGNFGVAYSYIRQATSELRNIDYLVVMELGAIAERNK